MNHKNHGTMASATLWCRTSANDIVPLRMLLGSRRESPNGHGTVATPPRVNRP